MRLVAQGEGRASRRSSREIQLGLRFAALPNSVSVIAFRFLSSRKSNSITLLSINKLADPCDFSYLVPYSANPNTESSTFLRDLSFF